MLVDLPRAPDLLDLAAVHDCDPVGHRKCLVLVVGHVHERRPQLVLDPLQLELHLLAELHVQRAERLVEEECRRLIHERPRQCHPLLLPAGELARPPTLVALELDDPQDLEHAPACSLRGMRFTLSPNATLS